MKQFLKTYRLFIGFSALLAMDLLIITFIYSEHYIAEELIARTLPLAIIAAGLCVSVGIIGAVHIIKEK